MSYFSRRNKHLIEFSGYEEVSPALRQRLLSVLQKYVGQNHVSYGDNAPWYIETSDFIHEVRKEFPGQSPFNLIEHGLFHEVFTIIEIFLDMTSEIYYTRKSAAPIETFEAFDLSGSVYTINNQRVGLKIEEELAKKIECTKIVLADNASAYDKFFEGTGNLLGRKAKAEDVVKDLFVGFEDYLKEKTGMKDYGNAVVYLEKTNVVSSTQKALLEKIYAYRSDTYGVGHAGNVEKPHELYALWFMETVIPQILFIDRKLKQKIFNKLKN